MARLVKQAANSVAVNFICSVWAMYFSCEPNSIILIMYISNSASQKFYEV